MSPEQTLTDTTLLDEAERIKDLLLPELLAEQQLFEELKAKRLTGLRRKLGYEEVADDYADDLIDARNEKELMITPDLVASILPVTEASAATTRQSREAIEAILKRDDGRLIVIVGPCSTHDPEAALEYAEYVKNWRDQYGDDLEIIMRAYMEKPRSELGWKGLIYDPYLDESNDINTGVLVTRMLACQITNSGVPIAMERLNASTPQYFNGLVAYDAIGARNTTDQKAREYASGTSSPVGFKNTPEGSIEYAAQAVVTANGPHSFLGMGMDGMPTQVNTTGNELAHIILRGDQTGPNYSASHVEAAVRILNSKGLLEAIIIDASHGNSSKKAENQPLVVDDVAMQVSLGQRAIVGAMLESNLVAGAQKLESGKELVYGQSITDECVGLAQTVTMLEVFAKTVSKRRMVLA